MPLKGKKDSMIYFVVAVVVIIAGIATTALINVMKDKTASTDIRAKAGIVNTLKFKGVVKEIQKQSGIIIVNNVEFLAESRSGPEKNYGIWSVAPPDNFDYNSLRVGDHIEFAVESSTFNVASKSVVATSLIIAQ